VAAGTSGTIVPTAADSAAGEGPIADRHAPHASTQSPTSTATGDRTASTRRPVGRPDPVGEVLASDLSGPAGHGPAAVRRTPTRAAFGVLVTAVVVWYLFVLETAADNDVVTGFRTLIDGVVALPELVSDTSAYRSWWRYVNQEGWGDIAANTVDHVQLVAMSMLFATAASIVLGVLVHRRRSLRGPVLGIASVLITIPSLALFAIFISVPGIGIGDRGPIIALVLYSLLPILRNTITGLESVDSAIIESARGMGLGARQRLLRIELPLAWPVILTGLRVATLLNIGIAAIAPLVGGTGLGVYINDGLQRFPDVTSVERMWTGVVFTILLALVADLAFTLIRHLTTSKGLRP
jgi:osmoprotectant transport system permease protein